LHASNQGLPVVHVESSNVAEAYKVVISRCLGQDVPMRFTEAPKQGFLKRLFGGK